MAEEVGNLAQMSGTAAKEIRALLEDSHKQVAGIVDSTQHRVVEGKHVSQQAQAIFVEIAREITAISSQVQGVSEASQEQKLGIEQISKAMAQMDDSTKANSTTARQSSVLSRELKQQSAKLSGIAAELDSLIQGRQAATAPARNDRGHAAAKAANLSLVHKPATALSAQLPSATLDSLANRAANYAAAAGPAVDVIPAAGDESFTKRAG